MLPSDIKKNSPRANLLPSLLLLNMLINFDGKKKNTGCLKYQNIPH